MVKVKVPTAVLDGLEAVRRSGLTNMLDRPVVIKLARQFGSKKAAHWIDANRSLYAKGLFVGFEGSEEEK